MATHRPEAMSSVSTSRPAYRVSRFPIKMTEDQDKLESYLNALEGELVTVVPNVTFGPFVVPTIDFLLVIEKLPATTA